MKKVLSVVLSAAMALSLCTGCSSSSGKETTAAQTESAAEAAGETAEAGAETGEAKAAEGVMPAIPKEDLKVGVIHIGNPADGSGYSYAHDLGIVAMQEAVGLEDSQIIRKNNVADDDQTAIETAMRECVEEGCQIIFATSWGYMDACEASLSSPMVQDINQTALTSITTSEEFTSPDTYPVLQQALRQSPTRLVM